MATNFLNFQWQEVEPKYLNTLLSYFNLSSGLNLPKNFDLCLEILVQINTAVLALAQLCNLLRRHSAYFPAEWT